MPSSSSSGNGTHLDFHLRQIEARLARIESRLGLTLPIEAEPVAAERRADATAPSMPVRFESLEQTLPPVMPLEHAVSGAVPAAEAASPVKPLVMPPPLPSVL